MNTWHALRGRARLTPARIALAVAIAGVSGSLYLMFNDALTSPERAIRATLSSSEAAMRAPFPGGRKANPGTPHWRSR